MSFSVEPLHNMGARVTGLRLDEPISAEVQAQLKAAWLKFGVLVFSPAGHIDAEKQLRLSHVFGEDEPHTIPDLIVPGQENLIIIKYDGDYQRVFIIDGKPRYGFLFWHQDEAYTPNIPIGSLLRMVEVPDQGGETGYLDIQRAYDDLPADLKARIDGLKVQHQLSAGVPGPDNFGMRGLNVRYATPEEYPAGMKSVDVVDEATFPLIESSLVVRHPYSNRKTMLLSPFNLVGVSGMDKAEGDALLHDLCDRVIRDEYIYVHTWKPDEMVLWDNWTSMHMGMGYPVGQKRLAYRTTIKGPDDSKTGRIISRAA